MHGTRSILLIAAFAGLCSASALADDIEFSATSVSVAEDRTTTYIDDVVVRAPKGTAMQTKADSSRTEGDRQIFEGNVEITLGGQRIKTKKAIVTKGASGELVIKMDLAESTEIEH